MSLLELKDVCFSYHSKDAEVVAVKNVSFKVEEGAFTGIIGPSGCGKTTILNLLAGIYPPASGEILLRGKKVSESASKIGLMPQRDQLFPWRTIENNVLLGPELMGKKNRETRKYATMLLKKYGLGDFIKKFPSELSGGMRQRSALIRTLVLRPDILLLDEPFSALDFQTRITVCDDVHSIIKQEKKTALLVSHDINECVSLCDKIIVLSKRPAHVLDVIDVKLNASLTPLQRRECADFPDYFKKIWKLLEDKNERSTTEISEKA